MYFYMFTLFKISEICNSKQMHVQDVKIYLNKKNYMHKAR